MMAAGGPGPGLGDLRVATPPAWFDMACDRWRELLVDHANCEKVNGMANLTRIFGDYAAAMAFSQQIDKAYDSAKQSPQFSLRWDSTGWAPMPAIPAVRRIKVDGKVVWTA